MNKPQVGIYILSEPLMYPPTINAANILAEKGYDVHIYGIKYFLKDNMDLDSRVYIHYLGVQKAGIKNVLQFLYFHIVVLKESYKRQFEWIIAYDGMAVLPAYISAKTWGLKWIYHQHDFWEKPVGIFQKLIAKIEYSLGRDANIISFPQRQRSEEFTIRAKLKNPIILVHNGPRKSWVPQNLVMPRNLNEVRARHSNIILYQGGFSRYFFLDSLLKSVKFCKSDFCFLFVGRELEKGYKDYLVNLAEDLNIGQRVIFWEDYVSYDFLPNISSFCDLGISKLTFENDSIPFNDRFLAGASNKIAEYMACGLPILLSDNQDNREYFVGMKNVTFCNPVDPHSISKAIDSVLLNKNLHDEMRRESLMAFRDRFNFDTQFDNLYNKMLTFSK